VLEGAMGAILTTAFVLLSGAAFTGLGLALATWLSRLGRAVGLTVTVYVLVTVGWLFLAMMLSGPRPVGEALMMASPFFFVGELTFEIYTHPARSLSWLWGVAWLVPYTAAALALPAATLATFNRCLGRVDGGSAWTYRPTMKPLEPVLLEEVIADSVEPA
jgi:hypothetical protein